MRILARRTFRPFVAAAPARAKLRHIWCLPLHGNLLAQWNPGVNFINVKRAHFSYERQFSSYVLALNELSYEKRARLTLMKLTTVLRQALASFHASQASSKHLLHSTRKFFFVVDNHMTI